MTSEDRVLPFGIDARTGRPIKDLTVAALAEMLGVPIREPDDLTTALKQRAEAEDKRRVASRGSAYGIAPDEARTSANDLTRAGWGILYGSNVDENIKRALEPLIKHRQEGGAKPFIVYDGNQEHGLRPNEDVYTWLRRLNVRLDQVEPENGVPYYLLIVASPQDISFEFQYTLDLYWACGRLWFDRPEEFAFYARSIVAYEKHDDPPPTSKEIAIFAPKHDFDEATQLFTAQVAEPLCGVGGGRPVGEMLGYRLRGLLGHDAKKEALAGVVRGCTGTGTPALLFSGGHGMQFPNGDARQLETQGALVCQDWEGYGEISEDHWFAAKDLPGNANVHGMIHFMFACHGGGVPQFDDFDRLNESPAQIAPRAFFSRLPQALLAHRNGGALAVLAHMERAWAYSFQGDGGSPQNQGFRGVLTQLLAGDRIGNATDSFNVRWAAIATRLSDELVSLPKLRNAEEREKALRAIRKLWVQRDDARNFMVFGDPAVAIRAKDLK